MKIIENIKIRETKLATITGISLIKNPYNSQSEIPRARNMNMARDMSFADLFLYIFNTCGIRADVVIMPAIMPIKSEKFLKKSIAMFITYILLLKKFFVK